MTQEDFLKIAKINLSRQDKINLGHKIGQYAREKRFYYKKVREGKFTVNDYPEHMFRSPKFIPFLIMCIEEPSKN